MEIQSDENLSGVSQPGLFSTFILSGLGIIRWLIWFCTFNDEDQLAAGIFLSNEKPDR